MPETITTRASRAMAMRMDAAGRPASLDEAVRTVQVVASTEEPALVFDWDVWKPVREVLLMSGCQTPPGGQVPLLNAHSRESVGDVIGSFRSIHVEQGPAGPQLAGACVFSAAEDGPWRKVCEGHITDVSVGYEVVASQEIRAGESAVIEGRSLEGPLRVATQWRLFELSLCPIGADQNAKVRAASRAASPKTCHAPARRAGKERTMPQREDAGVHPDDKKDEGLRALVRRLLRMLGREDVSATLSDEQDKKSGEKPNDAPDNSPGNTPDDVQTREAVIVDEEELAAVVDELAAALTDADPAAADPVSNEQSSRSARAGLVRELLGRTASDPDARAALAARAERLRISGIRSMAQTHALPREQEERLIHSGCSLARAKEQVFDMISQRRGDGPGFTVAMGHTEQEKFRAAMQDALHLRAGVTVDKPAAGAEDLRGFSLREMAREMVFRSGRATHGDIRAIVGRALTSTDLPALLVETSRRVLMDAYEAAPETWREWCGTGNAVDFKKTKAIGMEGDVRMKKIPEYGEYEEGRLSEQAEEYAVETFGRKLVISRQSIINDDLGALTETPRLYGESCAELVGDVAYGALLRSSLLMGDGKPLFCAGHANLFAGKGGVPTVDKLGAVVTGMKLQQDSFGKKLTVVPKFFLAGVGMETACEAFFNTQISGGAVVGTQAQPLVHNPYGGSYFKRVHDRRIDDRCPNDWFLTALRGTVTVFFLGGVQAPYIESQDNFDTDGFESKVRMDVGAKALRWVTMARAAG